MVWAIRRVVTGHDKNGKSVFLMDGPAPNVKEMASMPGLALTDLWETGGAPADNSGATDAAARPIRLEPPPRGSILRIVEFPPDSAWRGNADSLAAFNSIGAGHAKDQSNSDPMMHTTATVDYLIVLKGEIHAIVDTGETLLKPGDIMIQRGTNHSWSVRGTEPCILAAILIDARPLGLAAQVAKARRKPAAAGKTAMKKSGPVKKAVPVKNAPEKGIAAPKKKAVTAKNAAAPRKAARPVAKKALRRK